MPFISYAQNMEDVLLWRALQDVEAGFYIDVGAGDPRHDSVTLAFYERGWHGINIDPEPANIAALRAERARDINLELAVAAEAGQARFYQFPGTGWSTLSADVAALHQANGHHPEERIVETQTLRTICENHAGEAIHFLKVDVEGSEEQVIASGDFTRFRPWIVVVEATVPDTSKPVPRSWEPALLAARYRFAQFDGLNCYYVSEEQAERRLPLLATPANIFDDYVAVHQIERARAANAAGARLPVFTPSSMLEEAERRATAGEQRAAQAEARARDAELRMLEQEMEVQLLHADAAQATSTTLPVERGADQVASDAAAVQGGAKRLFFDATLMLHHGFLSAVGIVRVEHYVAEYLARDPSVALDFVTYDKNHNAYRSTTLQERSILEQILFHRYGPSTAAQPGVSEADNTTAIASRGAIPTPERFVVLLNHWSRFKIRLRLVAFMPPGEFTLLLNQFALRRLPARPEHSVLRRAGTRLIRQVMVMCTHCARYGIVAAAKVLRSLVGVVSRLTAPDPGSVSQLADLPADGNPVPFQPGDVLVSMANTWDYMDYHYLAKLGREMGVRLICVVYDVVGMELPFVTPAPAHLYQRHWVEIGHASERLIAISRFSAESYERFIAQPNGIDVPVDHALLPNFLRERAAEIGEMPVNELAGKTFVLYCSTIEVRKNHILLLHVWEELRQRIAPAAMPILVFVGKWGWSAETVRLLVERNWRLRPFLRVYNETSDPELIWLYRHARFSVFPSLTEGFGLAASESLSFGTPVVTSHCPALLEATEDLMPAFHPHDFFGWLHEIERLILDDAYVGTLRDAATRFRGPAYETFAATLRDAALAPSPAARSHAKQGNQPSCVA